MKKISVIDMVCINRNKEKRKQDLVKKAGVNDKTKEKRELTKGRNSDRIAPLTL